MVGSNTMAYHIYCDTPINGSFNQPKNRGLKKYFAALEYRSQVYKPSQLGTHSSIATDLHEMKSDYQSSLRKNLRQINNNEDSDENTLETDIVSISEQIS